MNQTQPSTRRPLMRLSAVPVLLFMLLLFGASPETAQGQWTTDTNIHNMNPGNVGIGTVAPAAKLDVNGSATFSGATTVAGRGVFSIDSGNNLNLSMYNLFKINASGIIMNGSFETYDSYFGMRQMSNNSLRVYIPYAGSAYFNQGNVGIGTAAPANQLHVHNPYGSASMRVSGAGSGALNFIDSSAAANSRLFQWRSEAGLFRLALVNDAENAYVQPNILVANASGNVGIGMTNPAARLDVLQVNGAAIRALSGSATAHTSIQLGRTETEGSLGIAGSAGQYAVGAVAGDVILRTEALDKKLLFANGNNAPTLVVANTGAGVNGNMNVSGTITGGAIEAKYQDVAEWVVSSQKLEAGTVVALDPEKSNQVLASSEAYDTSVAGVVSAQPGISLGVRGEGKVLVATTGRVKVKVDATHAPIKIGDLLVTSDVAGMAMKSEPVSFGSRKMHAPGTLIGKALEPLATGKGEILVLLSLQ